MNKEKHVDESWKDSVAKDKESVKTGGRVDAEPKIHVQGDWKQQDDEDTPADQIEEVSSRGSEGEGHGSEDMEINFLNYISSLGFQALIFLGEVPNPVTNQQEKNLSQAKFLIDTLGMLKTKTKGNLNRQEETLLNSSVYELQMKYVEHIGKDGENSQ